MSFESISGDADKKTNSGVSRRTVIKAGAHAAWAVPLVQIVAAAPAIAVSDNQGGNSQGGNTQGGNTQGNGKGNTQ